MVGMLQIMTYLLCVYLVYKGVEILQIGIASSGENRRLGIAIGVTAVVISLIAAAIFATMIDSQAAHISASAP